ncbi:MAG: UPF0280 family protein [Rhodobacteraceae bacterium]|nr:UPF0280 family protein [Paracoccaceae bacterium]MCP5341947.1 UPF0280 family protein [Paracoccaceae bacterium]
MSGPVAALLDGGGGARLHLQHGPIDLIIGAEEAQAGARARAFRAAADRFETVLSVLVDELPLLRMPVTSPPASFAGPVARRMADAVARFSRKTFITPMAAVAGAVADEVLAAMRAAAPLARAYVNNGGDIALHLAFGARFSLAMAGSGGGDLGRISVTAGDGIGGIATSGRGGRSLSMGIADSVTVLGADAATADAAATLIANAVDLPGHGAVGRCPANERQPESDLGARLVVTRVGPLSHRDVGMALNRGAELAEDYRAQGLILGAALFLRGKSRLVGCAPAKIARRVEHA